MLKKILEFVRDYAVAFVVLLATVLMFTLIVALCFAALVLQGTVAMARLIPRLPGLAVAALGAVALWVAYRLSERKEEPENDDYAY